MRNGLLKIPAFQNLKVEKSGFIRDSVMIIWSKISQESLKAIVPMPLLAISSKGLKVPNSGTSPFFALAPKATFTLRLNGPSFKSPIVMTFALGFICCSESIILRFKLPANSRNGLLFFSPPDLDGQ